ncbi:MAG: hypothetical protein HY081_03745 [Gammaproteobacteria bacterium]|nr:hypothetical protein [Gammaproteobacteria bacterium]
MKLLWHGEARTETDATAAFYNERQPGLAQRLLFIPARSGAGMRRLQS